MFYIHRLKILCMILVILLFFSTCVLALDFHQKIELECTPMSIILPDGRVVKEMVAAGDGQLYIPYQLIEDILRQKVILDDESRTLSIGYMDLKSIMSNKLKVDDYNYDNIRSYLYYPDIKINKPMSMDSKTYDLGYSFTNVEAATFNLDGEYSLITGLLGCEDFNGSSGEITFYLDDKPLSTYPITKDQSPTKICLSVTGGTQLKIAFSSFAPNTQIDFADVLIH